MTASDLVSLLDGTKDRAELLAMLAPLRLSLDIPDSDKGA